ncbi:MAG: hypothetical protein HY722_02155 [Planctomycetes bacterium]|nr:hypothetical protein [Planctomycetota bacterium]
MATQFVPVLALATTGLVAAATVPSLVIRSNQQWAYVALRVAAPAEAIPGSPWAVGPADAGGYLSADGALATHVEVFQPDEAVSPFEEGRAIPVSGDRIHQSVRKLYGKLAKAGDLIHEHMGVHEKVGEEAWEADVKPGFVGSMIKRFLAEGGDPLADPAILAEWARQHQDVAREALHRAAGE